MISDTLMTSPAHGRVAALLDTKPSRTAKPSAPPRVLTRGAPTDRSAWAVGPVDLSAVPSDEWLDHLGAPVAVPAPLEHFLRSTDLLTDCALDMAEFALERHYGLALPWRLIADRGAFDEEGNRSFTGFYLQRCSPLTSRSN
jgi:hypothetical protein